MLKLVEEKAKLLLTMVDPIVGLMSFGRDLMGEVGAVSDVVGGGGGGKEPDD